MPSSRIAINKGHKCGKGTRSYCVYSVYDAKTTLPIIIDGTAQECARAMGVSPNTFYSSLYRFRRGELKRWEIYARYLDGGKDARRAVSSGG